MPHVNRKTRVSLLWGAASLVCVFSGCSNTDEGSFDVPYRTGSPRVRTGAGGKTGSGGAMPGGTDGGGGKSPCGCPNIEPLTPCCTTEQRCGYVVGAGCFELGKDAGFGGRPGSGGAGGRGTGGAITDATIDSSGTGGSDAAVDANASGGRGVSDGSAKGGRDASGADGGQSDSGASG